MLDGMPLPAQQAPTSEALYNAILRDAGLKKQGEDFCWHSAFVLHGLVRGYQAWQHRISSV